MKTSPHFRDGRYHNAVPTETMLPGTMWQSLRMLVGNRAQTTPPGPIPIVPLNRSDFDPPPASGLRVTWLGHATVLLEIGEVRLLIDPVWSERVSPIAPLGPKRFHPPPLPLEQLPALHAVIVSHDHYDHLDRSTIIRIGSLHPDIPFILPLGVGRYLERWGIDRGRIQELDWGDATRVGSSEIKAQPARHFSGRTFIRDRTFWAGWTIRNDSHRVYYSGDTGYYDGLATIGRDAPFDLSIIAIGAYSPTWPMIHVNPEEALRLHQAVDGGVMLPVHWGTFNLAFHAWDEPVERLFASAAQFGVRIVVPLPGQSFEPATPPELEPWWRKVRREA